MATECGELVSEVPEEEPEIDPENVIVGQCGQDFPVEGTPGETREVRVIATNTNEQAVETDIVLRAAGQEIGRERGPIAALSNQQFDVTITIPAAGRYRVRAEATNVTAVTGFHPQNGAPEPVRAGADAAENGEHRAVTDGGVAARTALARACGGCAERSRKMSAANRRLRDRFDVFGRAA